jgi:hypothetical protein
VATREKPPLHTAPAETINTAEKKVRLSNLGKFEAQSLRLCLSEGQSVLSVQTSQISSAYNNQTFRRASIHTDSESPFPRNLNEERCVWATLCVVRGGLEIW